MNPLVLLSLFGRKRELVTLTYNANATVVIPVGVTMLNTVTGKGVNGTSSATVGDSYGVINVSYRTDTSTGSGNVNWNGLQSQAPAVAADLNADGSASWTYYIMNVWPDGTNSFQFEIPITVTDAIPGSASVTYSGGWQTSGAITSSGSARVTWLRNVPGAAGADASGLGFTFSGGAPGAVAPSVTHNNVAVTPGGSYPLVVPSGATIQITYYL